MSEGNHTVSETGGTGTPLGAFFTAIGGDCAADGTVNLALGDNKMCTITNFDNAGGCASGRICCEPGDGEQGCLVFGRVVPKTMWVRHRHLALSGRRGRLDRWR